MSIQLLGPLRVWRGSEELMVGPPKQKALLALLASHPGTVVGRDQIVDALWGADVPDTALNGVHTYVAGLRRVLDPGRREREAGSVLLSTAGGYELRLPVESVDAALFARYHEDARRLAVEGQPDAAFSALGSALGLWRGDALAGVPGPFAAQESARLREMRFSAAEDWIAGLIAIGRCEEAVVVTGEAISQEPLRERLRCLLMLALYRCGRQAHALQAYGDARAFLREELGIEPGLELRRLQEQIIAGTVEEGPERVTRSGAVPAGAVDARSAPRPEAPPGPRQLPSRARTFVGREAELGSMRRLFGQDAPERGRVTPLVSIDGPPGVGKSAFALEAAHEFLDCFPDGQLYADLGATGDCPLSAHEVLAHFLQGLGTKAEDMPEGLEGRASLYRSLLYGRRMLVLVDDVMDMRQIETLIPPGPAYLLVTSRRPQRGLMARYGARRISLAPLESDTAVDLLVELLDDEGVREDDGAVHRLVELCDRLPLGIRIAAATLLEDPHVSPGRLAERYEDPATRLDLLTTVGEAGVSVRAALGASYRSLSPGAARVFRRLSAIEPEAMDLSGPCGLWGLPRSELLSHMELLADLGLLERAGAGRYRITELVRTYAEECARAEPSPHPKASPHPGPMTFRSAVRMPDCLNVCTG
ncbi:BTAD domain-containing putative transcriptional regulator [Streptomyces sp. NPDC058861]|uniref:AfsR/SARP family transcriptional regulator n=1 Tax=Streptomyces sp. NPDC058861 TaxID=3346653 RepID=UPI003684ADFF